MRPICDCLSHSDFPGKSGSGLTDSAAALLGLAFGKVPIQGVGWSIRECFLGLLAPHEFDPPVPAQPQREQKKIPGVN